MARHEQCVDLAEAREQAGELAEAQKLRDLACRYGDAWTGCSAELKRLQGAAREARAAELSASMREVALFACCHDAKAAPTTPITALITLGQAIDKKDAAAFATHVHPSRPLQADVDFGGKLKTILIPAQNVDPADLHRLTSFHPNGLVCGELVGDEARCTFTPVPYTRYRGPEMTFTVAKFGERMYVVRIEEQIKKAP